MTSMPALETERLIIRPFAMDDLDAIHRILDVELAEVDFGSEEAKTLDARREWLRWTILNYDQLARLYQPPYGERAIVLKSSDELIGAAGYVPCLNVFGQLPVSGGTRDGLTSTEFGLYYALSPAHHRRGYAAEAVRAMIDYAFRRLRLRRIIATTTYNNKASMGVMRKVGMRIEKNPFPDPPWLQVVGVLEAPST
ncbi:MAG TPA: GNAT family N-acetyltransferase [Anaerolineae bacterium]|nr:GNAT family N-acetyltransferase [Anaerolineae bacterium]